MIEKVNPSHPDKLADRIAGAIVDLAYTLEDTPKIAVEVLIGHGWAFVISETSVKIPTVEVESIVKRIAGDHNVKYLEHPQNEELSDNQNGSIKAGDNGIFKGVPVRKEIDKLSEIAQDVYSASQTDGKYILDGKRLIVCQSNLTNEEIEKVVPKDYDVVINPLGFWTGGTDVDTGATNRKLGSDMGDAVTGGGLHGKDLSKADVSVNIYAHLLAQEREETVEMSCAIGDETIDGIPYDIIVEIARRYVQDLGGFEKLAEWGLV